ncbi:uncharacterized protein LOC123555068 isoform X2 [Mercenaria mercenaria]|uniref:uncharacterized protein LOC123555068 isoform X2 n=1 Tax=Mercenaria mercenaria TaxID=6596 RepID=UPI00234F0863|nr:uncharacterized protein LOC123555068 isoform X2 [Mercenaria mercenaria]
MNSVKMLFSKMKDSVLDLLTPSWLSDFLADLHISSQTNTDTERSVLKTEVKSSVSEQQSNGIQGIQGQQVGDGTLFLQGEGSRPPDFDLTSRDELHGQGQMMSILNQEEVFSAHGSVYRSPQLSQDPDGQHLGEGKLKSVGSSSSVFQGLSGHRYSRNKRKYFEYKGNTSPWKKQKTHRQKLYDVTQGRRVRDDLPYRESARLVLDDSTSRNTLMLSSFHSDMVEKLSVKAKPSHLGDRVVTDAASRRILDVIEEYHKPLYMIIPDLQTDSSAPKLKYFIPTLSQVKKPVASTSQTTLSTGTCAIISQSSVNTETSVSQSSVNTETSVSQLSVNTGTFISQSPVTTRTLKDVKLDAVQEGPNLQSNKAVSTESSGVSPKSVVKETEASVLTSTSAVFKFLAQPSVPMSTTKSDLGTSSDLGTNSDLGISSSYSFTSPYESEFESFVHRRDDTTSSQSLREASSHSTSLHQIDNQFLSATGLAVGLGSNMTQPSSSEFIGNSSITTPSFRFDSPASFVGQSVIMKDSAPTTSSGFTSTSSSTSSTAVVSTSQGLNFGSALSSYSPTLPTSAFKFSNNASVTDQKFQFDTHHSSSASFKSKSRSAADSIPSKLQSKEFDRSEFLAEMKWSAMSNTSACSSSFSTQGANASSNAAIVSISSASLPNSRSAWSSAAVGSTAPASSTNSGSASLFDSKSSVVLSTSSSATPGFKFNFVTTSSTLVTNSRSETTLSSTNNSKTSTSSVSPSSNSVHGTLISEFSFTTSVFSLDSKLISTSPSADSAKMYGTTPGVNESASEMGMSSSSNSVVSRDIPRYEDINSNASFPAVGFGQSFHQQYSPNVSG